MRIVNKKLEDMRSTTVGDLQKRQAAALGQMDQVEQDILSLKSQLEETYHLNQRLREQNKELEATISSVAETEAAKREEALKQFEVAQREKEARLTEELNEKLRQQQESVKAIQQARIIEAERRAKEAAIAAQLAKTRSHSVSTSLQSSPLKHIKQDQKKVKINVVQQVSAAVPQETKQQESPQRVVTSNTTKPLSDTFQKAQKLFDNNKFEDAQKLFEQLAGDSNAANNIEARFMVGECLYEQKEFDKAIMQYQNIISQYPDHASSPEAMLKQGMAFEKLADKDTAKVIYKKLLKKHSSSEQATTAQQRLSKL